MRAERFHRCASFAKKSGRGCNRALPGKSKFRLSPDKGGLAEAGWILSTSPVNIAEPVAPASDAAADGSIEAAVTLPASRPGDAGVPRAEEHDHDESGCVCLNCSGKGACGRNR
jgi:hypothetical protein